MLCWFFWHGVTSFLLLPEACSPFLFVVDCGRKGLKIMISFELTKESKSLLELLYSVYACRRKEGESRSRAKCFFSARKIQETYLKQMDEEDVFKLCIELRRAGCISGLFADNTLYEISLTDDAIIYGEQTFKRNVSDLAQWLLGIKGFLPL